MTRVNIQIRFTPRLEAFKTLNAERPNIKCKTVEISSRQTIEKAPLLLNELSAGHHQAVKYDGDQKGG